MADTRTALSLRPSDSQRGVKGADSDDHSGVNCSTLLYPNRLELLADETLMNIFQDPSTLAKILRVSRKYHTAFHSSLYNHIHLQREEQASNLIDFVHKIISSNNNTDLEQFRKNFSMCKLITVSTPAFTAVSKIKMLAEILKQEKLANTDNTIKILLPGLFPNWHFTPQAFDCGGKSPLDGHVLHEFLKTCIDPSHILITEGGPDPGPGMTNKLQSHSLFFFQAVVEDLNGKHTVSIHYPNSLSTDFTGGQQTKTARTLTPSGMTRLNQWSHRVISRQMMEEGPISNGTHFTFCCAEQLANQSLQYRTAFTLQFSGDSPVHLHGLQDDKSIRNVPEENWGCAGRFKNSSLSAKTRLKF